MVDAVDGRELKLDQLVADGIYNPEKADEAFSRQLSLPEIGCSMSHYNIYQKIVERNDPVSLVLEDDALLLPDFAEKLQFAYQELPQGWGLLNLNCPCERYERVGQSIVKYDGVGSLPVASSAYLISRLGAELMLDNTLPLRYPADSLVGRGLRWGVETYGVVPAITSINNVFPTQIQPPIGVVGWCQSGDKEHVGTLIVQIGYRQQPRAILPRVLGAHNCNLLLNRRRTWRYRYWYPCLGGIRIDTNDLSATNIGTHRNTIRGTAIIVQVQDIETGIDHR